MPYRLLLYIVYHLLLAEKYDLLYNLEQILSNINRKLKYLYC